MVRRALTAERAAGSGAAGGAGSPLSCRHPAGDLGLTTLQSHLAQVLQVLQAHRSPADILQEIWVSLHPSHTWLRCCRGEGLGDSI